MEPPQETVYASSRSILCLAAQPNGIVWAGTTGGVLRYDPQTGDTQHFTVREGLPGQEVRAIVTDDRGVTVTFATAAARWNGMVWSEEIPKPVSLLWQGQKVTWDCKGLTIGGQKIGFPSGSQGSLISAVAPDTDGNLIVALFGEARLYGWNGHNWYSNPCDLSEGAGKEITCVLVLPAGTTCIGTRRHGLYFSNSTSAPYQNISIPAKEPFSHNAQAMCSFQGKLYVSTLEDGLCVFSGKEWDHITVPDISLNAPRQMVVFRDRLYVRQGNGKVDTFDGNVWTKDVFATLPRKQVSALATDGQTLYLGQWGGWSVWDGTTLTHHLILPELQGFPVTALCPSLDGTTLWVGTQGKGLIDVDMRRGTIRHVHNEQDGLSDDWVTDLTFAPERNSAYPLVGTFVGGLCEHKRDGKWQVTPTTEGENITGIVVSGQRVFVATRHGVRRIGGDDARLSKLVTDRTVEGQCLCGGENGLWVGTRTGIYYCRYPVRE
jgi:ligand-binding sensor domain-containing protein